LPKDTILKFFNTYRLIDGDDEWALRACVNWYKTDKSVHDCVSILASDYETEWYAHHRGTRSQAHHARVRKNAWGQVTVPINYYNKPQGKYWLTPPP